MKTTDLLSAESHFAFGKNWIDYSQKIDETRIEQAITDLQRLSGHERFDGKSFLDIGCGSGLHSLAAIRMGASHVIGLDIDADSVVASRATLARFAPEANTQFDIASVFDVAVATYGLHDIVYSWGVLHHTGDMRRALGLAASLVKPEGMLIVALYRKTAFCGVWRVIKRWYASTTSARQRRAAGLYVWLVRLAFWLLGRDFHDYVRTYGKNRGMDFYNDVHDWMGGYPYESISPEECRTLFGELGFRPLREFVRPTRRRFSGLLGSGCDEYAFVRTTHL